MPFCRGICHKVCSAAITAAQYFRENLSLNVRHGRWHWWLCRLRNLRGLIPRLDGDLCVVLFIFNGATADDSKIQAVTFWIDSCTRAVGQVSRISAVMMSGSWAIFFQNNSECEFCWDHFIVVNHNKCIFLIMSLHIQVFLYVILLYAIIWLIWDYVITNMFWK